MKEGYIPRDKRKKILMLSDDIRTQSGVGNMAKEIILNSAHSYNWVNLGGAVKHPEAGQGFDLSPEVNKAIGITDSDVKVIAANGYGDLSPDGYSMTSALIAEFLLTAFFLLIILGSTNARAPKGFAPIAIGLALTLIHLISIPITNTSVNPARSTSQALFAGADFTSQLWLFWVAPIAGAIVAGLIHKTLFEKE